MWTAPKKFFRTWFIAQCTYVLHSQSCQGCNNKLYLKMTFCRVGLRSTTVIAQQYELNWPYCSDMSLWGKLQPNTTVSELITALKRYCSTDWLIGRDAGRHYLSCRQLPPAARHVRCWQTLTFSRRVVWDRRRGSDGHYLPLITVMRKGHRAAVTDTKPSWRLALDTNLQNPSCCCENTSISLDYVSLPDWQTVRELPL